MAVLVVAPFAPTAGAQIENPTVSTPTTLYFHVFDTFTPFPINTQPMNAEFFEVGGTNFPSVRSQGYEFNTLRGFSTSGPVEYDFIENGRPRFHPERGIAQDVVIDKSTQPVVYIYVEVRDLIGLKTLPNGLPTFHFEVTMREGDDLSGDLDGGKVIMDGLLSAHVMDARVCPEDLGAFDLDPVPVVVPAVPVCSNANDVAVGLPSPDGLPIFVPDAEGIIEFAIPMNLQGDRIPKADAFNVRIDWWQTMGGAFVEEDFSTGFMRLVSKPTHLPRLEMNIMNPVYIDFIHPQVAAGTLLIHTGVNSPWGTYDVDVDNITIAVEGPSTPGTLERVISQNSHVHNLHDQPAEITYLWRFRDEGAASGEYKITLEVPNLAGTALAKGSAGFNIEGAKAYGLSDQGEVVEPAAVDDDVNETPGPAALMLLTALGAAAILGRRRR